MGTQAPANEHAASGHGLTAEQLDELGSKLGAQVRFVADPTARDVVASAAWALTQAARCA